MVNIFRIFLGEQSGRTEAEAVSIISQFALYCTLEYGILKAYLIDTWGDFLVNEQKGRGGTTSRLYSFSAWGYGIRKAY